MEKYFETFFKILIQMEDFKNQFNSQKKEEASQLSISGWMDKHNVVYTYNGVLFSLKKEWFDTCYNIDGPWGHYVWWKSHRGTNAV